MPIEVGLAHELTRTVTPELSAHRMGNEGIEVLGTPGLALLFENAAFACVAGQLQSGETTVGRRLDFRHLAATPLGDTVRIRAEVAEADGCRIVFRVEAFDSVEKVGEGTHERYVVDRERFLARAESKRSALSGNQTA